MNDRHNRGNAMTHGSVRLILILIGLLLSLCSPSAALGEPSIELNPASGGPGTAVAIAGFDFPAGTAVQVRLGPPDVGASPRSYGEAKTDKSGGFNLVFEVPAEWPNGTRIQEDLLTVVVINEDASVKATASFAFQPAFDQESGEMTASLATVESIEVRAAKASSTIMLLARGYFADTCSRVSRITQDWVGNVLHVTIHTLRLDQLVCAEATIPFEEIVVVDAFGVPPGSYAVNVNGVSGEITVGEAESASADPVSTNLSVTETISSLWFPIRDAEHGFGLALPCFWVIQPPPGAPSARSYDEGFAMAHSIRGNWIDGVWPPGAVKLDLTVLEYEMFGVDAGIPTVEAIPLLIDGPMQGIEPALVGGHQAHRIILAGVDDPNLPDYLLALDLSPGKLLVIGVYPRSALNSADVQRILGSLALSPGQQVVLPDQPPTGPVDGRQVYFDADRGVCFSYPESFELMDNALTWSLIGPQRGDGRATLTIETEHVSSAVTLSQMVDERISESPSADSVSRQPARLDRAPAELLDWEPGQAGSLEMYAIHEDQLYHLVFSPLPDDSSEAGRDMNDLFLAVATSWSFRPSVPGEEIRDLTLAIPEANVAVRLPAGSMLVKNSELFRRGSYASYDFTQSATGGYPYLAEIQFFSRESIQGFVDRCAGTEYPCFYGDYPDLERYDGQKDALNLGQGYRDFESAQFNGRSFLVSEHECVGVPCIVREYTTFIGNTKIDTWVMMAEESQREVADALFAELNFQDDLSGVATVPGLLYVQVEPGLTLRYPLSWEIRYETDPQGTFVSHSVSFIPPAFAGSDQPQVPAVNLFVYKPELTDSLEVWLRNYSTSDPFGSPAGPETHFFGVGEIAEFRAASVLGLNFSYDVLGLPARQMLFSVGQRVVGLSYVEFGAEDLEAPFAQMLSSLTLATSPAPAPSDVETIIALTDLVIYRGPDTSHQQIGQIADGQTALVTGASQDAQWWRVICPNDTIGDCWVSADLQLAQPTTPYQR
jgi:hypothetical protein